MYRIRYKTGKKNTTQFDAFGPQMNKYATRLTLKKKLVVLNTSLPHDKKCETLSLELYILFHT